jgi:hypothetical protein
MTNLEHVPEENLIDKIKYAERVGILHIKGYSNAEIASLTASPVDKVKVGINEYKKIIAKQVDEDPYFLEKVQFNTIKALQEFEQLSKEAWETVNIATDHGMVPARIQALKLAGELATKKAQLHKLLSGGQTDGQFIARMQKAESVNQILSRVLRDVISRHPNIADEVRKELQIAFDIMKGDSL